MNVASRGIRNAFRNLVRTFSIVLILGLSMGLALSMLVAHQAVSQKINTVKSSVDNTVTVNPAGVRGFEGGGNPLTESQLASVKSLPNVTSIQETLNDRLTTSNSNLQSPITAGSLGQRFAQNSGQGSSGPVAIFGQGGGQNTNFTPPIIVLGTNSPTDLANTQGGGTFKLVSGNVFPSGSTGNIALVGSSVASKNNLTVGSTFTAYNTTIKVVGIFDSGNSFSNNLVVMPLSTVQTLSGQTGDVSQATIYVNSVSNVNSVTSTVQKTLGSNADVTNSAQQAQQTIGPLESIQSISLYSLVGAVIAGSVIILLTMIMIVRERRREIGVIKAIGASNVKVMLQFMTEAITLTVLASIIGIVLGVVAGNPITKLLVNNSTSTSTSGGPTGFATVRTFGGGFRGAFGGIRNNFSTIHGAVGWSIIIYGLAAAIIIAVIGSVLSSYFIAKVRPAEVMRVE